MVTAEMMQDGPPTATGGARLHCHSDRCRSRTRLRCHLSRPNAFNTIPDVTLDTLSIAPWAFVKLSLITLGTGLATGILPAIKAYRAVRS